jgi:exopolysaccharide production protein ExoZ
VSQMVIGQPDTALSSSGEIAAVVRNEQLDWLRGMLALSIMFYHLTMWEFAQPDASTLLGRLGVYGVSMFFVLSGLSIAIAYHRYLVDAGTSGRFLVRRIFRIWPLLWVTVLTVSAMNLASGTPVSLKVVIANLTTLFGFISPTSYMTTGAWSIGNEMVYYALTPILLLTYRRSRMAGHLLVAVTVAVGLYFSTTLLSPSDKLSHQWATYVNPFNNLCLYCLGVALFFARDPFRSPVQPLLLLACCVAVFLFYPVGGDTIHLVTGVNRIVFCLASVGLVFAFYRMHTRLPTWLSQPLVQVGLATYGVYLLHSLIWQGFRMFLDQMPWTVRGWPVLIVVSIATILIAGLLFHTMESYFIRLGKRLTSRPMNAARPVGRV